MKAALPLLLAAAALAGPTLASAGGAHVDVTPTFGTLDPRRDNLDETIPGAGSLTAKHGSSSSFGGRLDIWLNDSFALEGAAHFAGSSTLEGQAFGIPGSVDASLFYGTVRGVVGIGGRGKLLLSAGLGTRSASYDTPAIEDGSLTVGVVGVGALLPLGEAVSLRFDLDDHIYNMYWEFDGVRSEEQLQHDVIYSVGLSFHTGR